VLLNNAPPDAPTPWFHGQVIDMLYFPIFEFVWPEWVPGLGGQYFEFFSPVFNIADSSIFIGVLIILVLQKRFFGESLQSVESSEIQKDTALAEPVPMPSEENPEQFPKG
jgi:signal peptidase II